MKLAALAAVLGVLVACTQEPDPPDNRPRIEQIQPAGIAAPHGLELKAVDDGSLYMKKLFEAVSLDRNRGGIAPEVDQWKTEHGAVTDYMLTAASPGAITGYLTRAAAADPSLAVPLDRELAFERMDDGRWRTFLLHPTAELDASSIAEATATLDPSTARPIVLLGFTPEATAHFGELTTRLQGHKLAVLVDGTVTSAPVINSPIVGGRASVTLGGGDAGTQWQQAIALAGDLAPR